MQEIIDHDGFEDVELEVTGGAADVDGDVVAEDLGGDHGEGLALRGVDLAGHDGGTRLVIGDMDLADAAARTGAEHPNVVGNFHQAHGDGLEGAMALDDGVMRGERLELIGGGDEGQTGEVRDLFSDIFGIPWEGC